MTGWVWEKRSFTLVELISVMVVVSILMAMALPRYGQGAISKLSVDTTGRQIVSALRLGRRLAIAKAENYSVRFSPSGGYTQYEIYLDGPPGELVETKPIPARINCAGSNWTGTGDWFTFTPFGNGTTGGTLTLSSGTHTRAINIVFATGRVYMD